MMNLGIRDYFGVSPKYLERGPATPDGRPITNVPPETLLRNQEAAQARRALTVKVEMLDLFNPDQMAHYREVLDHIANKHWTLIQRTERPDTDGPEKHWWVKIEYAEIYAELPSYMAKQYQNGQQN